MSCTHTNKEDVVGGFICIECGEFIEMGQDTKPREFWIIYEKGYSTWVSDKALNSADTTDEIHVIEYSAYDKQKTINDDLHTHIQEVYQKIEAERAKNQRLVEALKCIESGLAEKGPRVVAKEALEANEEKP